MRNVSRCKLLLTLLCCAASISAGTVSGAPPQQRPPVTAADYGRWETLGGGELSPDGVRLAVSVRRVDGTFELRLHDVTAAVAEPRVIESGGSPTFSADSRWLAYSIGYSEAEQERMREHEEPVRNKVGLLDLDGGAEAEAEVFDGVASFGFDDGGGYLWTRGYPAEDRDGADLVVRDLASGASVNFGNVTEHAWQDDAPRLAMTIVTESGAGNGVQLYEAAAGTLRVLDSGNATFTDPSWREDAADLAVLRSVKDEAYEQPTHMILAWRGLDAGVPEPLRLDPLARADFAQLGDMGTTSSAVTSSATTSSSSSAAPTGIASSSAAMRVVEHRAPSWSDDGDTIFFGIREWTEKPAGEDAGADEATGEEGSGERETGDEQTTDDEQDETGEQQEAGEDTGDEEPEPADVDVWHARDERIIPMQKLQERRDRERSYLTAWHLDDDRIVRLGSDYHESIELLAGQRHATETDRTPYITDGMFGREWVDVDLIDVATGERTRVVDRVRYFYGGSATGRYLLYFNDDNHFAYDVTSGAHVELTSDLPTSFVNEDYDYPVEQKPAYGMAGWAEDDEAVLLYDRYDVWSAAPDGSDAGRLTAGAEDEVRHRYVRLGPGSSPFGGNSEGIDLDAPMVLSIYGEWTKRSGYARLAAPRDGGDPEPLVWLDKSVGRLTRADDAEVFAYVVQDFDDSPDYFAGGPDLAGAQQITSTNPFQADFAWGRSELIDYACEFGPRVQGALFYPAGYEAGRTYPMITYVYERLSQGVHSYSVPSERSAYNPAVWTSRGYFVLEPDIVYRPRMPGTSAVECIRPAVETVTANGMVDADRVGLVGHSWGGYEAAFVPTKTDIFAAAVSGAALTNFFSMFGTIHWNQGMPEASHFETGQARMGVPYWEDMEAYVRESPVIGIPDLETPMLMAFGDEDGTVDWHQGVEMYNYARRAGKQFVLLVYAGENHSNRQKKNQIDYHRRILEWFGHYLQGEPAAPWITEGLSVIERADQLREIGRLPW